MNDALEVIQEESTATIAKDINGDGFLQGPCPNCSSVLRGEFCMSCGQSAKDMSRPFLALFADLLGSVFALDGRLARTLPPLMFRPGHVTRAYIEGKRMRYVPPFRLFLIASVLFFLLLFGVGERQNWMRGEDPLVDISIGSLLDLEVSGQPLREIEGSEVIFDADGNFDRISAESFLTELERDGRLESGQTASNLATALGRLNSASIKQGEIFESVQKWAPRVSFLLLPFTVLSLAILHMGIRRIFIFHHVIVAIHLQTYVYMCATLAMLFSFISPTVSWGVFFASIPIYVFVLLGRTYDTSRILNIGRTIGLLISTLVALLFLTVLVSVIGANEAGLFTWSELIQQLSNSE